jgi:hypothetical protein
VTEEEEWCRLEEEEEVLRRCCFNSPDSIIKQPF